MSGDIGTGATRAAVKLGQKVFAPAYRDTCNLLVALMLILSANLEPLD